MRNLKKILAMVLALVMSLSLMATAGASSFKDVDDSNPYGTAIDVLDALKVFIGYEDGSFQPDGQLTRAEAAVLVYRIATGDVNNDYVENYTYMANSKFNDLDNGYGWAKGYINYCQNAEIIKGTSATTFSPGLKVTGYQLMVMVLRTLGYDKAGEFSDPITWELESARKCEQLGMLKYIPNTGDFGNPASRAMTAEILFRGLLQKTVKYSVMTPGGYTEDATTLGYQKFTLREVTGVVVANEYADLHRDPDQTGLGHSVATLPGETVLDVDGEKFNIDVSTKLEDLGESRIAYTTDVAKANSHTLAGVALEDTGTNNIVYNDGGKVDNITTSYDKTKTADRYINFGESQGSTLTTIKVTYQVESIVEVVNGVTWQTAVDNFISTHGLNGDIDFYNLDDADAAKDVKDIEDAGGKANLTCKFANFAGSGSYTIVYTPELDDIVNGSQPFGAGHVVSVVDAVRANGTTIGPVWRVEIQPDASYTPFDAEMVKAIFAKASYTPTATLAGLYVTGKVFRGTQIVDDYSDRNNYKTFEDNSIKLAENHVDGNINSNSLGWWLKIIDNDGDGLTDYVFQTRYTVAKVTKVSEDGQTLTLDTWNGTSTLPCPSGSPDSLNNRWGQTANNYTGEEIVVGDVVYYADIDGARQAWKCEVVEGKVENVNRNLKTVKLVGNDTVYNESAVHEHALSVDIASGVANMSSTTNMKLYLDKFGNLAAFSQNIVGNIVLLTDGWADTLKNGVDYAAVVWDRDTQKLVQYDITDGGSLFINPTLYLNNNSWNRIARFNPLNCGNATATTHAAANDDVHTILAYMETDGDTARLVPVDAFKDVQRENLYPMAMLDLDTTIPTANVGTTGTIWSSAGGTRSGVYGYSDATYTNKDVRATAATVYYFVYRTTWANGPLTTPLGSAGASVYVDECVGYTDAANYMIKNGISSRNATSNYVEDVYTAATRAYGQTTTPGVTNHEYYTADVVVVELNDTYYPGRRVQEQVFIYDFPEVTNLSSNLLDGWELAKAINSDGENVEIKVDYQWIRNYVEPTTGKPAPGLYYLERSYRTNDGEIWYVEPMSHQQIRDARIYSVGTIDASRNSDPYRTGGLQGNTFWVNNWYCTGNAPDGVHYESRIGTNHTNTSNSDLPRDTRTLTNRDTSKYYTLSYSTSGHIASLGDATAYTAMVQGTTAQNPDGRWTQVLVRYNSRGEVVYAVAFANDTTDTTQYAQYAWRRVLLSEVKSPVPTLLQQFLEAEEIWNRANDSDPANDPTAEELQDAMEILTTVDADSAWKAANLTPTQLTALAAMVAGVGAKVTAAIKAELAKDVDDTAIQAIKDVLGTEGIALLGTTTVESLLTADSAALTALVDAGKLTSENKTKIAAIQTAVTGAKSVIEGISPDYTTDTVDSLKAAVKADNDYKTNIKAIEDEPKSSTQKQVELNKKVDEETKTNDGIPTGAAADKAGGSSYNQAYENMDIKITHSGDVSTITVNRAALEKGLTEPSVVQKQAIKTLETAANSGMYAAGVSLELPKNGASEITKVEYTRKEIAGENVDATNDRVFNTANDGTNGDWRKNGGKDYLNLWLWLAEGTLDPERGAVTSGFNMYDVGGRTLQYTIKITYANATTATIVRTVKLVWA